MMKLNMFKDLLKSNGQRPNPPPNQRNLNDDPAEQSFGPNKPAYNVEFKEIQEDDS